MRVLLFICPILNWKPACEAVNELQAGEEGQNGAVIWHCSSDVQQLSPGGQDSVSLQATAKPWGIIQKKHSTIYSLEVSENICNQFRDLFTAKEKYHHVPPLCVLPRLGSNRIRAGRSCKCAAGGRSIKLSAGEKISWCVEKQHSSASNGACHLPAPNHSARRQASSVNMITSLWPPLPSPHRRLKGKGSLTFHRILLSSHDVNQRALQGVHVQTVVHSGAVLENTQVRRFYIRPGSELTKQTRVVMRG